MKKKQFLNFHERILKFHHSAWNESSSNIYEKYAKYCVSAGKFVSLLYVSAGVFTLFYPICAKLLAGKLVLPYGFKLPFIDEMSLFGYGINYLHHLFEAYIVVFTFIYADGLYAISVLHIYCVYDILCLMLDELNDDLENEETRNSLKVRQKLVKIIKMHQELLRFDLKAYLEASKAFLEL